jgi:hypothetical protein
VLLNPEQLLLTLLVNLDIGDVVGPILEILILSLGQTHFQSVASLF